MAGAVELRIHFIGQSDDELCIYRVVVDQKMFAHLNTAVIQMSEHVLEKFSVLVLESQRK